MTHPSATIIRFPGPRRAASAVPVAQLGTLASSPILARAFHVHGLVFGQALVDDEHEGASRVVAVTNLTGGRAWASNRAPWGTRGERTRRLATEVISALRPDWRESFWTHEFLLSIARDFARRFLDNAPPEGGRISIDEITNWMKARQIGRPVWHDGAAVLPQSLRATAAHVKMLPRRTRH